MRLADHIVEEERALDDGGSQTVYVYDEVVFELPYDRENETEASIEAQFESWWAYGSAEPEEEPTLEERVGILEELMMGGMMDV